MRPLGLRRDPAPSRIAYRMNRLMLTPRFRVFLRWGVPLLMVAGAMGLYFSSEDRRAEALLAVQEARHQIEQRPEFMVQMLSVDGASARTSDLIRKELALEFPVSSFDLDLGALHDQVAALEAVSDARVSVRAGGILDVSVTERVPVALWRDAGIIHLVDLDGYRVATVERRGERPELPLIVGKGAAEQVDEAITLIRLSQPVHGRLRGLVRVGERRWDLVLDRDQRLLLPEQGAEDALRQAMALHKSKDLFERDVAVIDMRNPDRMTLRLTPAAIDAMNGVDEIKTGATEP